MVKNQPALRETWVWSLGQEDPLEEGMPTHFSILAWRIPWADEPGGLQSMGLQGVRHDSRSDKRHLRYITLNFCFSRLDTFWVSEVLLYSRQLSIIIFGQFIFWKLYFEIIVDPQEVAQKCIRRSCVLDTRHLPMFMSYLRHYHAMLKLGNWHCTSPLSPVTPMLIVCICVWLRSDHRYN